MRTRSFRNPYPSAKAALDAWLVKDNGRGPHGLWGEPVQLGPDAFHVYGTRKRNGKHLNPVNVEFREKTITVASFDCRRKKMPRVITVVLEVKDENAAGAIWDAHGNNAMLNGCLVVGISDGDMIEKAESLRERLADRKEPDWDKLEDEDLSIADDFMG